MGDECWVLMDSFNMCSFLFSRVSSILTPNVKTLKDHLNVKGCCYGIVLL